jgi:hypothetical protein
MKCDTAVLPGFGVTLNPVRTETSKIRPNQSTGVLGLSNHTDYWISNENIYFFSKIPYSTGL